MKVIRILAKVILGIIIFVFFVIYVVIPVGVPWAVNVQGTKMLAHTVQMRSLWLNPFLLRVSVNGLKIFDADKKQVMAGFDKFWADLSFLSLLKKEYRVESVGLDGLVVNVALLPDGQMNLMTLAPVPAAAPVAEAKPSVQKHAPVPPATPGAALPNVRIDKILLRNARISFTDQTITPQFSTTLSGMNLTVTGISTTPGSQAKAIFETRLDEKGTIAVEALIVPLKQPLELETTFSLNNYALDVLTPYVGKYTGRSVKDGKLDLKMDYKIADNKINARHKLLIQKFAFGQKVESKDALSLPFGLALAILEDPQGRIDFTVPVTGDMSDPKFNYWRLLGQVARNFMLKLVMSPFSAMASMMGAQSGTEEMEFVRFEPGKSVLLDAEKEKLQMIIKLLEQRPKLLLEINGSYDPVDDWKQVKVDAFNARFAAMRIESQRPDLLLITQIYKEAFGVRQYWDVAKKFKSSGNKIDEAGLAAEMKRLVIEEGAPDKKALAILGAQRGQLVYDSIVAAGFDKARVKIGPVRETKGSMGMVPLEFTLTVYGEQ